MNPSRDKSLHRKKRVVHHPAPAIAKHPPLILIIGDSITMGVTELRGQQISGQLSQTYVHLLQHQFAAARFVVDANLNRTTVSVCQLLPALLDQHQPDVVLVMVGGNDADLEWRRFVLSEGRVARSRVPLFQYQSNLRTIAAQIIKTGAHPVLVDAHKHCLDMRGPFISKLTGKDISAILARGGGQAATDKELVLYRAAAAAVAVDCSCDFVDYGATLDSYAPQRVLGPDGVHLNAFAHTVIVERVAPVLGHLCDRLATSPSARAARIRPAVTGSPA